MKAKDARVSNDVREALWGLMARFCANVNRRYNRRLKLVLSFTGVVGGCVAFFGFTGVGNTWAWLPMSLALASAWFFVYQHKYTWRPRDLKQSDLLVDDELYALMAADPNLAEGFKIRIAKALKEGHGVTYRWLYEEALHWTAYLEGKVASEEPGAQALKALYKSDLPKDVQ